MSTLRFLVEKWPAHAETTRIRVTRSDRKGANQRRHVQVGALRPEGIIAILFFRHGDGTWRVFPPEPEPDRMAMRAYASVV